MLQYIILITLLFATCVQASNPQKRISSLFNSAQESYQKHDFDTAIKLYKQALKLRPRNSKAHCNLGIMYAKQQNYAAAIAHYNEALHIQPDYLKAHKNIADIYMLQNNYPAALHHYQQTLPDPYALIKIGTLCSQFDLLDQSYQAFYQLLQQYPDHASTIYNMGYTCSKLNRRYEAIKYYKKTIDINADNYQALFALGKSYLAVGNFAEGWPLFEHRYYSLELQKKIKLLQPHYLQNRTVVLRAEWGLGDTIQFIRYTKLLKDCGATVIAQLFKPLIPLLSSCDSIDRIIPVGDPLPSDALHIPLLSLPMIFKTTPNTIPANIPYIKSDMVLTQKWQKELAQDTNFKIGICWHAKPIYLEEIIHTRRSIPLKMFEPLLQLDGVSFYSLQKVYGMEELQDLPKNTNLTIYNNLDTKHGPFMDTAALMNNLDLVISADTSIVHVAGALGTSTWVLLPYSAEWRWMLNRSDSPWYPNTMQLFRQPYPGDWQAVMATVVEKVKELMKKKKNSKISQV